MRFRGNCGRVVSFLSGVLIGGFEFVLVVCQWLLVCLGVFRGGCLSFDAGGFAFLFGFEVGEVDWVGEV